MCAWPKHASRACHMGRLSVRDEEWVMGRRHVTETPHELGSMKELSIRPVCMSVCPGPSSSTSMHASRHATLGLAHIALTTIGLQCYNFEQPPPKPETSILVACI